MMSEALGPILQWLNTHPHLAGLVTFIISAAESVALIGTIVPGSIMMTALGALAGVGVIPLWSTIIWAIVGAIIGDNMSFFIGRYFKDGLRHSWAFRHYPQLLVSGENFFLKYGIMSVFIGRFIGPVRALVPLVAGMLKMRPLRYVTVSIIASICWAPVYMLPGILLGEAALELPPDVAVHVVLVMLFSLLFIILCIWIVYKFFVLVRNQINQFLNYIWGHLQRSRYFKIFTTVLKHHDHTKTHGQLILAFYFIITCVAFLYLATYVRYHDSADMTVNTVLFYLSRSLRSPALDNVMLFLTTLGDKKVLIPAILAVIGWLAWTKRWNTAWHVVALFVLTCVSIIVFKHTMHSIRPWGIAHSPETFSFPSGHTTLSMTFYLGLAILLIHGTKLRYKRCIFILMAVLVAAISISRIYLGAHWFTDVLGGWLLSAALLMLISLSYNRLPEKKIEAAGLIFIIFIIVMTGTLCQYLLNGNTLRQNYAMQDWPSYSIPLDSWWQQDGDHLPVTRVGRVGITAELFNLQWVGDLATIKTVLMQQGWDEPAQQNWITVLHRIGDVSSAEHFPLVSPLYMDKKPVLVLVKHLSIEKKLIVLRLWSSNLNIQGVTQPLWVGSIGLAPRTYSWLIHYRKNYNFIVNPALLFEQTPTDMDVKEVSVSMHVRRKHRWQDQPMILVKPKSLSTTSPI
jgi:membrane protein DedA with SNARE-associated domain/membrane-associated phospholipid phosphatase